MFPIPTSQSGEARNGRVIFKCPKCHNPGGHRRRRELEEGFNNFEDVRQERVRTIRDVGNEFLTSYRLRNPQSAIFAAYAVGHVQRLLGDRMLVEVGEQTVTEFQDQRLQEKAAPETINEEVGFLLRLMGDMGDVLRVRLRKKKLLKLRVRNRVGKAYDPAEKARLVATAKQARSPHICPALMLAMNTGMRGAEVKNLTWGQIDFTKLYLAVGRSKTEAGEGRTIPLNSALHAHWSSTQHGMRSVLERFAQSGMFSRLASRYRATRPGL